MNLKKFISLLFVTMLFASSVSFASNIGRNVYSVYSDNFNGAHFVDAISSDIDAVNLEMWSNQSMIASSGTVNVIEGNSYTTFTCGQWNTSISKWKYGGGGYSAYNTGKIKDMSSYYGGTLKFCVRSTYSNMEKFSVGIKINNQEVYIPLSSLGFSANGQWQEISIPLTSSTNSNITSSNLEQTQILFIFKHEEVNYVLNDTIDIDNIRWVKQNAGQTFSVVRKKVSDNTDAGQQKITFSSSTFGQGWSVAEQYLELDIDGEMQNNNWSIRVYTNNDKAGLYNGNDVLPTAWRVSCSTLPYTTYDGGVVSDYDSLKIAENKSGDVVLGLYDLGKYEVKGDGAQWWFPWFWFKNSTDGPTATDSIVWCYKGCCTFINTPEGQGTPIYYYDPPVKFYERKPKLFFACKTSEAKGVKYTAQFIFNLRYE